MWVLRFDNGITSAGVAVTEARAAELRLSDGAAAWPRVLADYPSVAEQFADAVPVREFTWMPRVPFRASVAAGPRWAMLPSAAAFIDPLFSTGIPMTLLGIERLAEAMEAGDFPDGENRAEARCCELGAENRAEARCCEPGAGGSAERTAVERSAAGALADYSRTTLADADHAARFVAGCYAAFPRFPEFVAYSMLYFAAASYSEMLRRLGRVPPGFLGSAEPTLAAAVDRLSPASGHYADLAERVASAVAHVNVAGLCDPAKRNWYGVDFDDTVRSAGKLGATADEVRAMLLASAH
jgi:FADH2 O2-dependent halogenase